MNDITDVTNIGGITGSRSVLRSAVAFAIGNLYSGNGSWLDQSGNGHDAAFPGGTNDPLFLPHVEDTALYLPNLTNNFASVPDSAAISITGDIEMVADITLPNWIPTVGTQTFIGKGVPASYLFRLGNVSGIPSLRLGQDGVTSQIVNCSTTPAAAGVVAGQRAAMKVTWRVSDSRVQYFLADTYNGPWTQLGTDVTMPGGLTGIFDDTFDLNIGITPGGSSPMGGKYHRIQLRNGIGGPLVLDVSFNTKSRYNSDLTTVTAETGQIVTLNRAATGRKSAIIEQPWFLFGTDDYLEVADSDDLDFSAAQDFTYFWRGRLYGTTADQVFLAKKADLTTAAGYVMTRGTANAPKGIIADGTTVITAIGPAITQGVITNVIVRRRAGVDLTVYTNGVAGTPVADTLAATLANAGTLRIGRLSGAGTNYADNVTNGWGLFRSALSDSAIANLSNLLLS